MAIIFLPRISAIYQRHFSYFFTRQKTTMVRQNMDRPVKLLPYAMVVIQIFEAVNRSSVLYTVLQPDTYFPPESGDIQICFSAGGYELCESIMRSNSSIFFEFQFKFTVFACLLLREIHAWDLLIIGKTRLFTMTRHNHT